MKKLNNLQPKFVKVVLMAMVMLFFVAPNALKAQGTGTEADPFLISTAEQLTSLAECVNTGGSFYFDPEDSKYYADNATGRVLVPANASQVYFRLTADIELNSGDVASCDGVTTGKNVWPVLGNADANPFDGVLDGDYHIISGVLVKQTAAKAGFIGVTGNHAEIRNLGVVNSYVSGGEACGGLIGNALHAVVANCFFSGTVYGLADWNGGLIGQASSGTTVTGCYTNAMVSAAGSQVGGFVGRTDNAGDGCAFTKCYSASAVYGKYEYTGGFIGEDKNAGTTFPEVYYDQQMVCIASGVSQNAAAQKGTGMSTTNMTNGSWALTGFTATDGLYPAITGFDLSSTPAAFLSVVPIILPVGGTLSDLSGVDAVTLGASSEVNWSLAEKVGDVTLSGNTLSIGGQCYVVLRGTHGGTSRVFVIQFDKEALLGSAANPFTIDNSTDLTAFRDGIKTGAAFKYKHFTIPALGENTCFLQTADIDLSSVNSFKSIALNADKPFKGTYDGGNHAVIGWRYGTNAAAFFCYTEGATIKNLTMRNVLGPNYAALIYSMRGGLVDNCHAEGSSTIKGGLIYETAVGDDYTCIIQNSTNKNNFNSTQDGTYDRVGGIVSFLGSANNTIENCHNYGNITAKHYTGGIVGGYMNASSPNATITKCSNSGNIVGTENTYSYVGGIASCLLNGMTVSYCYNKGNLVSAGEYLAGIVATGGTISYCYNLGNLSCNGLSRATIVYGISKNNATFCFNAGNIFTESSYTTSDAGYDAFAITDNTAQACFNAGDIYSSRGIAYSFTTADTYKNDHYTIGRVTGMGGATPGASYFDATRTPSYLSLGGGTSYTTAQLTGTSATPFSSSANWVCEAGVYPRIKGLDTLTISKVLALPILFETGDNVDHVTQNFRVRSQWDIVWRVDNISGASISAPSSNYQTVTVPTNKTQGNIILYAYKGDSCYYQITLKQGVAAPSGLTVANIGELRDLRTGINSGAAFTYKGTPVPAGGLGTTFTVTADFALGEAQWTPIGTMESPFLGIFDGNGHTLSGLAHTTDAMSKGLFGYVSGKVKNLTLTEVNVSTSRNFGSIATYLAGAEAEVSNCHVKGKLTATQPAYCIRGYRGGIVGVMSSGATISGCLNEVEISDNGRHSYNGGIVAAAINSVTITNCKNAANITGGYYTGGISSCEGNITYCVNYGDVTGYTYTNYVAGIVSYGGTVESCVNSGKISVPTVSVATRIAGIAASNTPKYCYNVGEVEARNALYAGGISCANATQCYNAGKVTGDNAKPICRTTATKCYFDNQMSVSSQTGAGAISKATMEMTGTQLSSNLGDKFVYTDSLYPRIAGMENTAASYATASPIFLHNDETVVLVESDFTMGGCSHSVTWEKGTNTAITISDCDSVIINVAGIPTLEAKKNDTTYKKVTLYILMDAFLIKDEEQMANFRDGINTGNAFYYSPTTYKYYTTFVEDSTSWITVPALGVGATFRLINDLDFDEASWTPVGTSSNQFNGTFDGYNHSISNFTSSETAQYKGLFGRINSGSVKDLTISGVNITNPGGNAGILVGYVENSEIMNVNIHDCRISGSSERVGALAGSLLASICRDITISHVYVKGTSSIGGFVGHSPNGFKLYTSTVSYSHIEGSGNYVGGVVGYTHHDPAPEVRSIMVIADTIKGYNYVGGWTGQAYWHAENPPAGTKTVDVIGGTITGHDYVGGIIGAYTSVSLANFTNSASVYGHSHVGGIAGCSSENRSSQSMARCYNTGDVTGTGDYVGGIYGGDRYESGFFTIKDCYNAGNVEGVNYVGGISGRAFYSTETASAQGCVNIGDVTGTGDYVGGIIGESRGNSIGNLSAGRITGNKYVGGIVGQQSNYPGFSRTANYNVFVGQVYGGEYVGSVAGYNESGTILNSYYDKQMSSRFKGLGTTGEDAANVAEGKLTREMLGDGIRTGLGTDTYFGYTTTDPKLYPRPNAIKDSTCAIVAATPVVLADDATAYTIPGVLDYPINPTTANSVTWAQTSGNSFIINVTSFKAQKSGMSVFTASRNDLAKNLEFVVGISSEMPCVIKNYAQLTNFTNRINAGTPFYYDTNDSTFHDTEPEGGITAVPVAAGGEGFFFKLAYDPSFQTEVWPGRIGTTAAPFKGDFNGNNHTISYLPNAATDTSGFFGYNAGTVHNLTIASTNMNTSNTHSYVGALCGYNAGKIDTCYVMCGTVNGKDYVAPIAAVNAGYISNSYSSATVNGSNYVGGLTAVNSGSLTTSFNIGDVTAATYVGGLAGDNTGTIANCYNTGNITASGDYAGGLTGNTNTNISASYSAGQVTASGSHAGGVAGNISGTNVAGVNTVAYDEAMCTLTSAFQSGNSYNAIVTPTQTMVGTNLQSALGTQNWVYATDLYPRIKGMENLNAAQLSATPIFLVAGEKVLNVQHGFSVNTNGGTVEWTVEGSSADALNTVGYPNIELNHCGSPVMHAVREGSCEQKNITLLINYTGAVEHRDTTCGEPYTWEINHLTYTTSNTIMVSLTGDDGCPYTHTLKLVIPQTMEVTATSTPELCEDANNGTATATVTGGMGSSFTYEWTDLDSVRETPLPATATISNLAPDHRYRVIVTDAVNTNHCTARDSVAVDAAIPLVATLDSISAGCYGSVDGMFQVSFSGGKDPYVLSWSGAATGSRNIANPQTRYAVTGLPAGAYTITVRDANNCEMVFDPTLEENTTEYTVTAFETTKLYDGVAVDAAQYTLKIGTADPITITSGDSYTFANGDILTATVSRGSLTNVGVYNNQVTSCKVMRGSIDVTCKYNLTTVNKNVVINKRNVTVTSADSTKFYDGTDLVSHKVTVSGDRFTAADSLQITYNFTGVQRERGVSDNTFDIVWNEATPANYNVTKVYGSLTVIENGTLIVRAKSLNRTYDGSEDLFTSEENVGYTVSAYYVKTAETDPGYTPCGCAEDTVYSLGPQYSVIVEMNGGTNIAMKNADTVEWKVTAIHAYYNYGQPDEEDVTMSFGQRDTIHGVLQVNPREVQLISSGDTWVYDATEHTLPEVTMVGSFVSGEVGTPTATGAITNVGKMTNTITYTTNSGFNPINYKITKTEDTLKVTKRPLDITGVDSYVEVTGSEQTTTDFTYGNLVSGHTASGITFLAAGTEIGHYPGEFGGTLLVEDASHNNVTDNYEPNYTIGTLHISSTVKELKITSATVSETYNGQPHTAPSYAVTFGYQPMPSVDDNLHFKLTTGDTVVVTTGTNSQTHVGSIRNDFSYAIIPAAHTANYTVVVLDTGMINVVPREVTLRSMSKTQVYDGTAIRWDSVQAAGGGFVEGEGATYTFDNPGTWKNVGDYTNSFSYALNSGTQAADYTITKDEGTLTVNPATLTVKANDLTRAYGTANTFSYTITGFAPGEDKTVLTGLDDAHPSYNDGGGTQYANIGTYTITPILTGISSLNDNYTFEPATGTLTVQKRALVVNAPSVTAAYDGTAHTQTTDPILAGTITYTNLAEGDVVTECQMTYSRTEGGSSLMNNSAITINHGTTDVTDNYNVTVNPESKIIVTKRDLTIKVKDETKVYDGTELKPSDYEITGELGDGDVIGDIVYAGSQTSAGTSASSFTQLLIRHNGVNVTGSSYNLTLSNGSLTVSPKVVTITANDNTKVYGAADPTPLTDTTLTGLVAGESASLITCTLSREAGEAVGHYVITPSGDATQGNYSVTYENGDFEITKATLTVTVDAQTKVYGATDPTFTASISGLQNGDNEAAIRTALDLQFSRTDGEDVGSYTITATGNTLSNYNVTYETGTLTITRAQLTVTADNKSKTFGAADPELTATVTGLKNGDTESAILTALGLTYSRQVGESVGSYLITASGPSELANYSVSYEQGSLAITKAPLTIKLDTTKNYDGAVFVSNYAAATDGYTITGLQGTATITAGTVTSSGSGAGTYVDSASTNYASITVDFATSDGIDNYDVTYDFKQVIIKADLTITINATKEYDQTALTVPYDSAIVSVEGLMSGDALTAGVVTTNAVDAATYTHTGGTVNITTDFATTLGIDNYEVTYNVALIITPRTGVVVTVQEHGAEYEYDGSTHSADGYSVSIDDPLYQTSDFTFSGTASVTGTGTETGLNFYPMTLSAGDFTNTNPNFTNVTFTILDSALYIYPKLKATVTSVTGVSCPGATNGTATINVTGGKPTSGEYSFSLDGGLAEAFTAPHLFENLSAGSHTVVVADSLNYTATANFTIEELEILTATIVTPTELCPNQGSYPVSVNVSGGTAPYTYTWTGAQDVDAPATEVVQTEVNDGGTAYTVSVSILDANSCPIVANTTFTVKPSVTKTTSISDIVCPADMNITLRYGVYDTLLTLTEPTWTSNITAMPLTLVNDAPVTSRFGVREGREDSTYTIHWHLVDTCGGDSLICTQIIIVRFPECSAVTVGDRTYQAVRLGANCWTRSNLATPAQTRSSANGVYKYNNDDDLAAQFGLLYSWYAASGVPQGSSTEPTVENGHVRGICPEGWALPTADDYIIMVESIGGVPHMKTTESDFWVSGLEGTAPSSGFDALGAGFYNSATDSFEGLLTVARFWTATPTGSSNTGTAIQCAICEGEDVLIEPKSDGYSIRCVKINP